MTIYKWPYKKVAHHFIRLGMQQLQESTTSGRRWSCGRVHRVLLTVRLSVISLLWIGGSLLRYPWSSLGALGRVWCGVSECQAEGLLLEITPVVSWHSACEFKHPLEEADPLLMKSHVLDFVSVPQGRVQNLHCAHDLVQLGGCFIFLTMLFHLFFSYIFWSAWERGEQEFWLASLSSSSSCSRGHDHRPPRPRNVQWTFWMFPFEMLCAPACKTFWDRRGL